MEKGNTKDRISEAALELFSVQGFEATGISQIADAVGIRKASLYAHYSSKQDILDTIISELIEEYDRHSIFANSNWDDPDFTRGKENTSPADIAAMIRGQLRYIVHDPKISKVRKMLTIEQYQNPELSRLQSKQSYEDIIKYNTGLMRFLVRSGALIDEDPDIMAAQFAWPVSVWVNLLDREPEREAEVTELLDRHIIQFFRVYGVK